MKLIYAYITFVYLTYSRGGKRQTGQCLCGVITLGIWGGEGGGRGCQTTGNKISYVHPSTRFPMNVLIMFMYAYLSWHIF